MVYNVITLNKWWQLLILGFVVIGLSVAALIAIAAAFIYPTLPSLDVITDYQPKLPLRIYSAEGLLIGEFGQERRAYIKIEEVPKLMKDAVLAIEDRRFYQHNGVDTKGVLRAIRNNVTGRSHEGASTITMQVAKNFFSAPNGRRTIGIKINEALLALKIERNLTKNKILELYLNQIYLGQRSYGFAAASQTYYGKSLKELSLAESALLAGLPKAPSGYNPFSRPDRALKRQREVLRDMHRFGFIDKATYDEAAAEELEFKKSHVRKDFEASYVAEIVRDALYQKYKKAIYTNGLHVYTTISKKNQVAANEAVRDGLVNYELRHGYRGAEKHINISELGSEAKNTLINTTLKELSTYSDLVPAVVTKLDKKSITVVVKGQAEPIIVKGRNLALVAKYINPKRASYKKKALHVGDVIRVISRSKGWAAVQLPKVQGSLVSLDPQNGAVRALVGGFNFNRSKFNHATQAKRQPGSSFKPFVYSAAIEKGYMPGTIIEDEPIEFEAGEVGEDAWAPQNYGHNFLGPVRLRVGLAKSINTVAIRMLESIGGRYAQDYITRFGFKKKDQPPYLTMVLGAGSTTNWEMAGGYAVFANGGYRVPPYIIDKILDQSGNEIFTSQPEEAGDGAQQVIDSRNAFLMDSMLKSVIREGTGGKALRLGRRDIAGKTGTTNDMIDAWFAGYSPKQVAVVWMGYDKPQSLGKRETGGGATLPIWVQYMKTALKGLPEESPVMPEGIMQVKIDPLTGVKDDEDGIAEYFYVESPPPEVDLSVREVFGEGSINLIELLQQKAQELLQPNANGGAQQPSQQGQQRSTPLLPNRGSPRGPNRPRNIDGIEIEAAPVAPKPISVTPTPVQRPIARPAAPQAVVAPGQTSPVEAVAAEASQQYRDAQDAAGDFLN
jgi:penicillin-binding protein 1A